MSQFASKIAYKEEEYPLKKVENGKALYSYEESKYSIKNLLVDEATYREWTEKDIIKEVSE